MSNDLAMEALLRNHAPSGKLLTAIARLLTVAAVLLAVVSPALIVAAYRWAL